MTPDADAALMLRAKDGDTAAFEDLVRRHQRTILNIVTRYLPDRHAAEDVAQDVFFKIWRVRHTYEPSAKFTTWLYRIAVNHALNARRDRRPLPSLDSVPEPARAAAPSAPLERDELSRAVRAAVQALPDQQRMAVILARYHEMSHEEIAAALDLSVEAVKSLIFRAKEKLAQELRHHLK